MIVSQLLCVRVITSNICGGVWLVYLFSLPTHSCCMCVNQCPVVRRLTKSSVSVSMLPIKQKEKEMKRREKENKQGPKQKS